MCAKKIYVVKNKESYIILQVQVQMCKLSSIVRLRTKLFFLSSLLNSFLHA